MEKFIYEAKPYLYLFAAAFALIAGKGSTLMTVPGVLIGLSGLSVLLLRYEGRQSVADINRKQQMSPEKRQDYLGQKIYHID